ncbi:hypothetical protein [Nocardiopsis tropica]|uniref:Uncharacterized protein n=1 Tax=Nocardiopsis tropica TaxID=109330 RepID=A0ABU7KM31_9ACTN|nr:hypothetical protein [Nocardiopsis umidischolae]MEE2050316.1 hypothetical protein [Nocardiopsis umidischolae]
MVWTVRARGADRWVTWEDGAWSADPVTAREVGFLLEGPALLTPTGPVYEPMGPGPDPVAVFLNAASMIPYPVTVEGEAPAVPDLPPLPDDVVA